MAPSGRAGGIGGVWRFLGFASSPEEAAPRSIGSAALTAPVDPGRAGLGGGLALRGDITGEGDFHIYGRFEGEIDVSGHVIVSEAAQVDANINAASIVIAGKVRGNLSASTHLDILPTGVLTGTLKAGSFSAAEGSSVKGEIWLERADPARVSDQGLDDNENPR
ncbi:MAG TPA: polymer-forming cytoskeletal protein [Thermoanaerobaculia bacterium]|nr:polymer-forming cytoskeletal protein [Thermoanaerobaculia bacterium]